jgi:hypothetical protein
MLAAMPSIMPIVGVIGSVCKKLGDPLAPLVSAPYDMMRAR